jgi:hypothetical protein
VSDETNPEQTAAAAFANAAASDQGDAHGPGQLPPASLSLLLTSLGTQALMALGQITNPLTNQAEVDRDQARHCIDLLGMLETKTAGNRTTEESRLLEELLYELRMLFLKAGK